MIRQFSKNVFSSWVALGIRLVIVFLVNPFIIHSLGDSRYGAWALIFSIINYLTIFDMGMRQAVIRFVSKYLGLKDYDNINAVINTSFALYSIVAVFTIGISLILAFFILGHFSIPADFLADTRRALIVIGVNVAFNFFMMSWTESLNAVHRYDIANALAIGEDILRTVTIVILLSRGYGIVEMAYSFLGYSVIRQVISAIWLKKLHPQIKFGFGFFSRATFHEIYSYGYIGFLISIAWLFIANTDNVVVGYFFSAASVTKYAVAGSIIVYLRNVVLAVSFPLRPLISHYEALGRKDNITFIYTRGTKYLTYISFVIAGMIIIYADSFIRLWLGPGYEQTARILRILVLPAAIYLPQTIANSVLYGLSAHKNILYAITAEGIANLGLSLILLKKFGLDGVAYGTIIPQFFVYLIAMPVIIRSVLGIRLGEFYKSFFTVAIVGGVVSVGASYGLRAMIQPSGWPALALDVGVVVIVCLAIFRMIIPAEDWVLIKSGGFKRS